MNKARLIERIAELVNNKSIDDVSDIRDESDRDGMRIVIELKRGAEPQIVLNQLYKHTQMQESFSMIFLAVVNGQPKEMGLVQAIQHFIDHRIDVVRRRTAYLLGKAKTASTSSKAISIAIDQHRPGDRDHPQQRQPHEAQRIGGCTSAAGDRGHRQRQEIDVSVGRNEPEKSHSTPGRPTPSWICNCTA